ncbi:hypothetical protein SUGI_0603250 [Cryptomeria japonica]|nr:hypothetical protein SUGI_0603250 [Cryptomeria japonica]
MHGYGIAFTDSRGCRQNYSILTGTIVTTSSSILDEILLLERMETQSISEIEEDMRSSSRAIAVYALLGRPDRSPARMSVKCINPPA